MVICVLSPFLGHQCKGKFHLSWNWRYKLTSLHDHVSNLLSPMLRCRQLSLLYDGMQRARSRESLGLSHWYFAVWAQWQPSNALHSFFLSMWIFLFFFSFSFIFASCFSTIANYILLCLNYLSLLLEMSVLPASKIKKSNLQVRLQNPQEFIKIKVFYCILIVFCCILLYSCIEFWFYFFFLFSEKVIQSSKFLDKGEFLASNLSFLTLSDSYSLPPVMQLLSLHPLPHTLTGNHMAGYPLCSTPPFSPVPLPVNSLCSQDGTSISGPTFDPGRSDDPVWDLSNQL